MTQAVLTTNTPAASASLTPTAVDPRNEYVAGGTALYTAYQTWARALPQPIDDLERELRQDIYTQMEYDSHVKASTTIVRSSIVGDGLETLPAINDPKSPDHDMAQQLRDECDSMMDDLDGGINSILYEYTGAIVAGHKVGELTWTDRTNATTHYLGQSNVSSKQRLVLEKIKIKPRTATAFVVDAFMNTLGLLAIQPGMFQTLTLGMVLVDGKPPPNLIPLDKFAIYSFRPVQNDPRGTTILRAVYPSWWQKVQIIGEQLKYLTQFASPSIDGTMAEHAVDAYLEDDNGNQVLDANSLPIRIKASQAMANAIMGIRNGSYAVIPFGATLKPLEMHGTGEAFLHAIAQCNRDIGKGITTQSLATDEGEHASRAQATVHQDAFQILIRQEKKALCNMVRDSIYRRYVEYNYGPAYLPLTPLASLGEAEDNDLPQRWTAIAALKSADYFTPSQYAGVDADNSLPQRTEDMVALAAEEKQAQADQLQAQQQGGDNAQQTNDQQQNV